MSITPLATNSNNNPPSPQGESSMVSGEFSGVELQEFLHILWRQKKVILASVAVIMIAGFVVMSSLTPRYTASVMVEISPRKTQVVDFEAVLSGLPAGFQTIETEIEVIKSRRIAKRTVLKLNLSRDPEFNDSLRPAGMVSAWRQMLGSWVASLASSPLDGQASGDERLAEEAEKAEEAEVAEESVPLMDSLLLGVAEILSSTKRSDLSEEDRIRRENDRLANTFLSKLTVTPQGRSRIVNISFESENRRTAAAAANAVADFYIVAQLEAKFEATKRATVWLSERVGKLQEEVESKEREIEEYRAGSGLLQGGGDSTLVSERVSELNAQHALELVKLAGARARLRQVNSLVNSNGALDSSIEVLRSTLIQDLRRDEGRVEREIAELAEEYGESHPRMINARAELRDMRQQIKVEIDRIVQGLRNEVAVAQARAASLAASLDNVKGKVAELNQSEVFLRAREREVAASRILLETLLQRTKQTASQEDFQQADANVVSSATIPEGPSFPRKGIFYPLLLLGGLIQGAGLAFAIERLDLGFRSSEQVERFLGIKSLGLLPAVSKFATRGKRPHDYILEEPASAFGEAVRSLYTNLLLSDVVKRPKVILVTSSLPREGKTTVSLSIARMLASVGHRVVVVDCDLRRPTVHKDLGIEAGPGLTECLTGTQRPEDVVLVDEESGAHILRAGTPIYNSPEQLDSGMMQRLLRSLARNYDLVILDSAPILATSDTLFIARLADKTIFLTKWACTRRAVARTALKQVIDAQADVAGVLLTFVDVKSHSQYGYGDSGVYHGTLKKYYSG